ELYLRTVYYNTEPITELILTRTQVDSIISKYMDRSMDFLKSSLQSAQIGSDGIREVVLTGDSKILQIVPAVLQNHLDPRKTRIHNLNPSEMLTKGVTLLANDAIEREINTSLLIEMDTLSGEDEKNGSAEIEIEGNLDMSRMRSLIKGMQINRIGDM
ncbi:MAG: Hsp70 family protein, partial [Maribacter sp.]|uniref:Hsp70 family protein n=1 Tax=Maribacter sp. TaxID=1897614 RepID=UPI003C73C072